MDVARLRWSFEKVKLAGDEVPLYFYSHLFLNYPETRALFPAQMGAQRDRFVKALIRIIGNVDRIEEVLPYLRQLGRRHREHYGIMAHHYPLVGESLLATVAHFLGPEWTTDIATDWSEAYGLISQVMIEGAGDPTMLAGEQVVDRLAPTESVAVTAESTRTVQFPRASLGRRGYSERAVHDYLALVAGELEQTAEDKAALRAMIRRLEARVMQLQDFYRTQNSDVVVTAPVASADAVALMSRAQHEVDAYMRRAEEEARALAASVRDRCQELLGDAQREAQSMQDTLARVVDEMNSMTARPVDGH